MHKKLTCEQIISLISFYKGNNLNDRLKSYIDNHLSSCEFCRNFYKDYMISDSFELVDGSGNIDADLKMDLSAYVDNELDEKESFKIKKIAVTNPIVRKDLESMYSLKKIMHDSFNKAKAECKYDYSRHVISLLNGEKPDFFFRKLVYLFSFMIGFILIGFVVSLNF